MSVDERILKFREAIWAFTNNILPKISTELQPSVADIAWLIINHFFSPEDSEELYSKFQRIWGNRSVESNYHVELLAYCAWKIRLYLTFNQPEMAFSLFQQIAKTVVHKVANLKSELEKCCLPTSKYFPFPKIQENDVSLLYGIAETFRQTQKNLTLRLLANRLKTPFEELLLQLKRLEVVFGCMIAFEALGLYWLRAEVEINSFHGLQRLIERFKPLAYRCEIHDQFHNDDTTSFSVEFTYPIAQKKILFEWASENRIRLYRKVNEQIFQNFNVLYKEPWSPKDVTVVKPGIQTIFEYNIDVILLNKLILQIIDIYQKLVFFTESQKIDEINCLLPIHKIGSQLKTNVVVARQEATKLFQQRILIPYFYSNLLHFTPEVVLEGNEKILHDEAQAFLYARTEALQQF
ncbi:MAG: hypothetical protein ACFFDT_28665, partial [Candidatus Hodarchaeota archaeon]